MKVNDDSRKNVVIRRHLSSFRRRSFAKRLKALETQMTTNDDTLRRTSSFCRHFVVIRRGRVTLPKR